MLFGRSIPFWLLFLCSSLPTRSRPSLFSTVYDLLTCITIFQGSFHLFFLHFCLSSDWLPQELRLSSKNHRIQNWWRFSAWGYGDESFKSTAGEIESSHVFMFMIYFYNVTLFSFQRLGNIAETGVLDDATKSLLRKPRCGNPDFEITENEVTRRRRQKRYALGPTKWEKLELTWK